MARKAPTALTITITEGQSQWLHQAYAPYTPNASTPQQSSLRNALDLDMAWIIPAERRHGYMQLCWNMLGGKWPEIEPQPPFSIPNSLLRVTTCRSASALSRCGDWLTSGA